MFNAKQIEQVTKRLWELQEMLTEVEGIVLASSGGLQISSTLPNSASLQRMTAVSAALTLLSEHALQLWRGDQMEYLLVRVKGEDYPRYVILYPTGSRAVLIIIVRLEAKLGYPILMTEVMKTARDLERLLKE